jgi:hypothetical protein
MDEFVLHMDPELYRKTNALWNDNKFNAPWKVGYVAKLIESKTFLTKEEWEEFYYQSGKERLGILYSYPLLLAILNGDDSVLPKLNDHQKALNFDYGRTQNDLKRMALLLQQLMRLHNVELNDEEAFEVVRFRIICETWNGIIIRERKAITYLESLGLGYDYRKISPEEDYKYGVDYEVFLGGELRFGLQIKPMSYKTGDTAYLANVREANLRKNINYFHHKGVPVHYIYVNGDQVIFESKTYETYRRNEL